MLQLFERARHTRRKGPGKRASGFFSFGGGQREVNTPLEAISQRIKNAVTGIYEPILCDPKLHLETDIEIAEVQIGSDTYKVRRVFLRSHTYQVGWVVDCDLQQCSVCELDFTWLRHRQHCR